MVQLRLNCSPPTSALARFQLGRQRQHTVRPPPRQGAREGDEAQIKKLEAIGRPIHQHKQYFSLGSLISIMAPRIKTGSNTCAISSRTEGPRPGTAKNLDDGMMFTQSVSCPMRSHDLPKTACDIHTAFFVIDARRSRRADLGGRQLLDCVKHQKELV